MADNPWKFKLTVEGLDAKTVFVTEFEVTEAIFAGCIANVNGYVSGPVDPASVLGKNASFSLQYADEPRRVFHGVVLSAAAEANDGRGALLRMEIGSRLELLKYGKNSLIFQNMSVVDIVKKVLSNANLALDVSWQTTGSYESREYVAQYDESDFAFICRLLEEDGVFFAVHNDDSSESVVFYDDNTSLPPIDGEHTIQERENAAAAQMRECVYNVRDAAFAASDKVMLRDYDFTRPRLDLSAIEKAPNTTGREVYVHPGNFGDVSVGKRTVKRRLEALQARTRRMSGQSRCPRFEPGRIFTLQAHSRGVLNIDHLILRVVHTGSIEYASGAVEDVAYQNRFDSMPKATQYRPDEAPAPPSIGGVQVAFVTVPPGEEIHADGNGRAKVRFPWDRSGVVDDKSSVWLRVGQLPLGGSMIMPRKDFEVIVDFELADFDRPLVTGHLYNAGAMPPYALPGGATRSSIQTATTSGGPGANELRFEDSAGSEEIFLNASKDYTVSVENNASWTVAANETVTIGSNNTMLVGADHSANVKASRTLSVGATQAINVGGDYSDLVGASETLSIGGTRHVKCGGDHVEDCTGTLSRTVAALQCVTAIAGYQRKVVGSSTTKVGAAWTEVAGTSRASTCGGSRIETIGALKLIKAKAMALNCGAAYAANAGSYSVQCGGSRTDSAKAAIAVQAGGGMSVKAANIVIEAKSKLVMIAGGVTIKLSKAGEVSIKAASIDLTGVKALNQAMHKSN